MKQILSIIVVVIMVVSLVGCQKNTEEPDTITCLYCKTDVDSKAKFCPECGKSISDIDLATEEATQVVTDFGTDAPTEEPQKETVPENIFFSDWKEGEKNVIGNTSWNLNSMNYITEQGNWVYYFVNDELCKEDREGNKYVLVSQVRGKDIQIIGDWIYFYNLREKVISKIKTDGSEWITGYSCENFYVTENGIIYVTKKQTSASTYNIEISICDLNFENSRTLIETSKISDEWTPAVEFIGVFSNRRLYLSCYGYYNKGYSQYNYGFKGLYYIDLEKQEAVKVQNVDLDRWVRIDRKYVMIDNYIYSYDGTSIWKLDAVNEKEIMSETSPLRIYGFGLIENGMWGKEAWIMATNEGIWVTDEFRTVNGLKGFIITSDVAYEIALTHNYIYYYVQNTNDFSQKSLYRIEYSGENWEYLGIYNSYGG